MESRRVLVTGVNRGLGAGLASRLHGAGHEVWGTTRSGNGDLALSGHLQLDLADETSVYAAFRGLEAHVDGLDLLVNCAAVDARAFGADDDRRGSFDVDADTFGRVLAVNVTGPMVVTRAALPLLRRGRDPMIVNVSSQLGSLQVASGQGRDTAYCVSKAALNMLSVRSAAELRSEGIGVVAIHPGWVQTDMGGPSATMTIDESVSALVDTVEALTLADSGRFIRWDGRDHPW
jgi:NAD(P)-dependent dehydrogenase (short-subunit alcohol dehydrogenase family)